MQQKLFQCAKCGKRFRSERAVTDHARDTHKEAVGFIKNKPRVREETFADRAVAAEIALAMGEKTDDAWLLGL